MHPVELPDDLLSLPQPEAVRRIALVQLERARAAASRALDPADEDGLHAFRVALRRLRTTLRCWEAELAGSVRKKHRRALRELQAATGTGRDAEVGLAWLAAQDVAGADTRWIAERLRERLAQSSRDLHAHLGDEFARLTRELASRLEVFEQRVHLTSPAAGLTHAAALASRVRLQADELVERLHDVATPADREAQHAARIESKRLRYLVEPVQGAVDGADLLIRDCKHLQELLGRLNDAHVLGHDLETATRGPQSPHAAAREGLRELASRAEAEREQLFAELESRWLGAHASRILEHAHALATELDGAGRAARAPAAHQEIERKYLLSGLPPLSPDTEVLEIEQGWLPGVALRERLRCTRRPGATTYHRALKFGRGLVRTEIEEETTRELFDALWPLTVGCRVTKRRYRIPAGELVWEIDEFTDRTLVLAEVELPDAEAPAEPPPWLAPFLVREVTDERGFTNLELAR